MSFLSLAKNVQYPGISRIGKLTPFTYFFVMPERIKPKMWPINHHQWLLSSVEKSIQSRHLSGWCQVLPIHYLVRIIPWLGYVVIGSTPHLQKRQTWHLEGEQPPKIGTAKKPENLQGHPPLGWTKQGPGWYQNWENP